MSLPCLARQREEDKRKKDERSYLKTFSVAHRCTCPQTKSTKHQKYIKEQDTSVHSRKAESCVSQASELGLGGLTETTGQDSTAC